MPAYSFVTVGVVVDVLAELGLEQGLHDREIILELRDRKGATLRDTIQVMPSFCTTLSFFVC